MSATILFVDDERDVLDSLKRVFLDEEEVRVLTAESGKTGLEIIESESVQMVVADYKMPEMDGAELLTHVHARQDGTVGILLSAYADASLVNALGRRGVIYTFIAKPWNDDELRLAVRRGLEHRQAQLEQVRLQGELDRLRSALGRLPFGLVVLEPDGRAGLVEVNQHQRFFTRKPDVGHHFQAFLSPDAAAAVKRALELDEQASVPSAAGDRTARFLPGVGGGVILLDMDGDE
jgi:CheY-like chemotaxis protein